MIKFVLDNNEIFGNDDYSINILKVGQEHCHPHKGHVFKEREWYSLHFVLFGKGTIETRDGVPHQIGKGSAFLLYQGDYYDYYPDPSDPWSYIWVEFSGEALDKLFALCGFTRETFWKSTQDFSEYIECMKQMFECFDASVTQQMKCSAYFMLVVSRFIDEENKSKRISGLTGKKRQLRDILIYMNNNATFDLSIGMIARENGVSVRTLTSLFTEILDMTPMLYLNRMRISIACEKLQENQMNISEVSKWSGFNDPLYFSRVFKNIMGISPKIYQKKGCREDPFLWLKDKDIDYR